MWYSRSLCTGLYPLLFRVREASVDGVASSSLYTNPSTIDTPLLFLTAVVNNQFMKVMIDTGASKSFISMKALRVTQDKQFVNRRYRRV